MNEHLLDYYQDKLSALKHAHNERQFHQIRHSGQRISIKEGSDLLNLASNDYLGLAVCPALRAEFVEEILSSDLPFGSSSSRLLTGNFTVFERLEWQMQQLFGRACLLFNSGYHANVGILPAICNARTLIVADKLVHASIIDGMRLAAQNGTKTVRYQHQNLTQLAALLEKYQHSDEIDRIIVVTESIFSMDGDVTDLSALVQLKQRFDKVMLYVDEAHAIGVRGEQGLGCTEEFGVLDEVDFIVGAFGKAMASQGAYVICHKVLRDFLINTVRPLIFSTALPPVSVAWTSFVLSKMVNMQNRREHLARLGKTCQTAIKSMGLGCPSASQIVPVILGDNAKVLTKAQVLQRQGYYLLAVRPPTVPQNQARLRICLSASLSDEQLQGFLSTLQNTLSG